MAKSTVAVRFTGQVADLQRSIGKVNGSLASVAKVGTAAFAVVGALAVGAAVGLFKLGESFDEQFDKIRVGTGKTGDALKGLEGSFKTVLKTVPASFEDAGTAIAELNTRLGLTGKPLEDVAAKVLNLSRLTETDLKSNVAALPRVFEDWGVATEDQSEALDKIFRTTQTTGIGLTDLATKVVDFGSPLRNLGFTFEETLALFGKFEQSGVNTETVMAGLKQGLGNFAKAGKEPKEALAAIIEQIKGFNTAGEAMPAAIDVFGKRAAPDMVAAIREGKFELGDLVDTINNGSDTINDAAKDTESFGEKWTLLKNRVLVALEPLARKVFDGVGAAMDALGPKIDDLVAWFRETLVPAFKLAVQWVEENWPKIQETISSVMETVRSIISGVVDTITTLWRNFGNNILSFVQRVWPPIKQIISGAMDVIQGVIKTVTSIIKGDWSGAWEGIKQIFSGVWEGIQGIVKAALEQLRLTLGLALEILGSIFKGMFEGALNWLKTNWPLILAILTGPIGLAVLAIVKNWDKIKAGATAVKNWIVEKFSQFIDFIKSLPGVIGDTAKKMWEAFKSGLKAVIDWVKNKIDELLGPLDEIASKIARISGPSASFQAAIDKAKSQASGGGVGGGGAVVYRHGGGIVPGRGDVPVIAEGGEGVFTKGQMKALGAGAAGGGTNVVIRFDGASSDPIMRAFLAELRKTVRVEGGNVQVVLG